MMSRYIQLYEFLPTDVASELVAFATQHESEFVPASTSTNAADYRRARVLHSFPSFSEILVNSVLSTINDVIAKLGQPSFSVLEVEAQMTSHNDGDFYKIHNDNGSPDTASREISYVYFFNKSSYPPSYSGGELLIYDSKVENDTYVAAETFKTVYPWNNSIVFFLSRYWHQILPVSCSTLLFEDSRFTINGWVRGQSSVVIG